MHALLGSTVEQCQVCTVKPQPHIRQTSPQTWGEANKGSRYKQLTTMMYKWYTGPRNGNLIWVHTCAIMHTCLVNTIILHNKPPFTSCATVALSHPCVLHSTTSRFFWKKLGLASVNKLYLAVWHTYIAPNICISCLHQSAMASYMCKLQQIVNCCMIQLHVPYDDCIPLASDSPK